MVRLESSAHRLADVTWIEALMDCIETDIALVVKSLLREKTQDRHEIFLQEPGREVSESFAGLD